MTEVVRSVARNVVLNKSEQTALSTIMENPTITAGQMTELLSKSSRTVQRYLDSLQKKNIIKRVGSTKARHWEIMHRDDE